MAGYTDVVVGDNLEASDIIHLGNLHPQATRHEIGKEVLKIFSPVGRFFWVMPPCEEKQHMGYCFVQFHNVDMALRAIEVLRRAHLSIRGKRVRVSPAIPEVNPSNSHSKYFSC